MEKTMSAAAVIAKLVHIMRFFIMPSRNTSCFYISFAAVCPLGQAAVFSSAPLRSIRNKLISYTEYRLKIESHFSKTRDIVIQGARLSAVISPHIGKNTLA